MRAWTIPAGAMGLGLLKPLVSSTRILAQMLIKAEVMAYDDFVAHGGEKGCREVGKLRIEGKEYTVADGDVMHFLRFNV